MHPTLPFVPGRCLVDLVNELERRLTGETPGRGLVPELSASIEDADSYILTVFDGLGHHQLDHPSGRSLQLAEVGVLSAPFPTTTTVSMSTIATGVHPATHGVIGHLMWLPELHTVVNVLKWVTLQGTHMQYRTSEFLPSPNLWERLRQAGIEPITVQPADFVDSPLTRALYRGCRFEGVYSVEEAVEASVTLARRPQRLVFTYFPQLDYAAHVWGQQSPEYSSAMQVIDTAWSQLAVRAPVPIVGTADHGHIDYGADDKVLIRDPVFNDLTFYGDPRSMYVRGDRALIQHLAETVEVDPYWTHGPDGFWPGDRHVELTSRIPDAVLLAPDRRLFLPRGFDKRLTGYHGGLAAEEVDIPFLVG